MALHFESTYISTQARQLTTAFSVFRTWSFFLFFLHTLSDDLSPLWSNRP
uniref:Uncharacterized protein n=1 Tax=Anguilla anguilla TaxID=7936 RepID=A0A0E9P9Q7_ANGAN